MTFSKCPTWLKHGKYHIGATFSLLLGDLGFSFVWEPFFDSPWHPFGARSRHSRRQMARRGSRTGAGTSFVEPAAFRAMEMNGNEWNTGGPQVTSEVKAYLTDKTYD